MAGAQQKGGARRVRHCTAPPSLLPPIFDQWFEAQAKVEAAVVGVLVLDVVRPKHPVLERLDLLVREVAQAKSIAELGRWHPVPGRLAEAQGQSDPARQALPGREGKAPDRAEGCRARSLRSDEQGVGCECLLSARGRTCAYRARNSTPRPGAVPR